MSDAVTLLTGKITGNSDSLEVLNERKLEIQKDIESFTPVCTTVDSQIVSIASSIVTLQTEIINLSESAYAVGCGTTAAMTTSYPDIVRSLSYNLCTESYDGESPYDVNTTFLNSGNVGFGTFLIYTQNDSSQTGIGTLYGEIESCFRIGCTSGICVSFASSISTKQSQITTLRNRLTNLLIDSNNVKTERVDYEIQRYGNNYTIKILTQENIRISSAITSIQKYS